jgi:hypothetical protein
MLQWVGDSSQVLWNDCVGGQHVARIADRDGRLLSTLPRPVGAVSPDGSKALSHSFSRLRASPYGYGYANGADPDDGDLCPDESGIEVVDLSSGARELILSLAQVAALEPERTMRGAFHYLTHCQFSPSGSRLLTLHCWLHGWSRFGLRMITCSAGGGDVHVFRASGMVSHASWRDDERIVAFARTESRGDGYYLWRDRSDDFVRIGESMLATDGHPSFSPDGRWILTDTYPDRLRRRRLLLYDFQSDRAFTLAMLYSPRQFAQGRFSGMLRCDLHPRWDREGRAICFDSTHTGQRALCTLEIGRIDRGSVPRSLA